MRLFRARTMGLVMLVATAPLATAARAQEPGELVFETYGGPYFPGESALDTNIAYGARFGGRPLAQLGWSIELGGMNLDAVNALPTSGAIESATGYFVDADAIWYVGGTGVGLFAGVGTGHLEMSFHDAADRSENALTFNGGVHYAWNFGRNVLLKPEIRLRWWQGDRYDETDEEYTASVGWHF